MDSKTIVSGTLMDENGIISFVEICERFNISEDFLQELIEQGFCTHQITHLKKISFNEKEISRIQSASRLQDDLGINTPGVVLVLELLDELEALRNELNILERHVKG